MHIIMFSHIRSTHARVHHHVLTHALVDCALCVCEGTDAHRIRRKLLACVSSTARGATRRHAGRRDPFLRGMPRFMLVPTPFCSMRQGLRSSLERCVYLTRLVMLHDVFSLDVLSLSLCLSLCVCYLFICLCVCVCVCVCVSE